MCVFWTRCHVVVCLYVELFTKKERKCKTSRHALMHYGYSETNDITFTDMSGSVANERSVSFSFKLGMFLTKKKLNNTANILYTQRFHDLGLVSCGFIKSRAHD